MPRKRTKNPVNVRTSSFIDWQLDRETRILFATQAHHVVLTPPIYTGHLLLHSNTKICRNTIRNFLSNIDLYKRL